MVAAAFESFALWHRRPFMGLNKESESTEVIYENP
ncbi:hypothetical protein CfE428DRAFT_3659 [Chthoniobacter flavus Ellin428]|uniref:Uncharacterized protein n=1 Tax=Chthoniobacter flavus Ellin428 TaxID=497964 RepID=B4D421_9BACT|nr:hypothetical protein CfE428DRAFT_3659 [Chthoniobacter flavus Ellin428]TCO93582.1 hypothetical protein EV701_104286 [Chthoniobacter flavus]